MDRGRTDGSGARLATGLALAVGVVLRWIDLGGSAPSADEQFTGVLARSPLSALVGRLVDQDVHPPLDYVLRHPVVHDGSTLWLRAPSAVLSCGALLLVWRWARTQGWFGTWVVLLTAVLPFFVFYGRMARMYALLLLCGVAAFVLAVGWLRAPRRWHLAAVGALVLVAAAADNTGWSLIAGLALLPGRRRDPEAWRWRAAIVVPAVVWAAAWSPSLAGQLGNGTGQWIALADPQQAVAEVGRVVVLFYPDGAPVALLAVAVGGWSLHRRDPVLGWAWLSLCAIPVLATAALGFVAPVLVARSLAASAFGYVIALAALAEESRRRAGLWPVVVAVLLAAMVLPSLVPAVRYEEESGPAVRALAASVSPGDAVALSPDFLSHVLVWSLGAPIDGEPVPGVTADGVFTYVVGDRAWEGRLWVLSHELRAWRPPGLVPCEEWSRPSLEAYALDCFARP